MLQNLRINDQAMRQANLLIPLNLVSDQALRPVIPGRSNRRVKIEYDKALYKERNQIDLFFGRLKINRAIATRYDQLAESFLSMVHIAAARYWLKFVHAA
jgi:transposase